MNRTTANFAITSFNEFKQQMLSWANQFNICCFLDNHQYNAAHNSIECLLAVDVHSSFKDGSLQDFKTYTAAQNDWLFGHVNYDFKNQIHNVTSNHPDGIQFPTIFFFQPKTVIELKEKEVVIACIENKPEIIFEKITGIRDWKLGVTPNPKFHITPRITKEKYLAIIQQLKQHIRRGDCYEINFCQEFYAENAFINPLETYQKLAAVSPNPFSCFYKLEDKFLLCASPERYVRKEGTQIISQPIKGTFKRNLSDANTDAANKASLQNSLKDKTENVMVVDLVRNDLSKICTEGSVQVDELFAVYSFPQVHQMISTVRGELLPTTDFADVLQATFPMGSMTGAPKKRVLELTEQYEQTQRGIYSGCVGYIAPNKDFDFNVVIRSIMYNQASAYLSYQVGGGITFYSDAEKEYEECLLKAEAMKKVLE